MRKPIRLTASQQKRLRRLLDMDYKPSELAAEIGLTTETIYRGHLPAGAPFTKDKKGSIWINGLAYRKWVEDFATPHRRTKPMPKDYAFCFTCNMARPIQDPKIKPHKENVDQLTGKCSECGKKVSRLISKKERENKA